MKNLLDSLREHTIVVADTADIQAIRLHQPTDATTNPSLVLKMAQDPQASALLDRYRGLGAAGTQAIVVDRGYEILQLIPGRISTEVDAQHSYDTEATITAGRNIHSAYRALGVPSSRILIKIAATWEGIQAAKTLESEGIACNLTLMFSLAQAIEAANANVTLISPFVGRVYDWFLQQGDPRCQKEHYVGENDPGVVLVRSIYHYYKTHGIPTQIMGASFRNTEQILALAGCDLLTISPDLLQQLGSMSGTVQKQLPPKNPPALPDYAGGEACFKHALQADRMANEKLTQGIQQFILDSKKLAELLH